ncbi:MAG: hypothetical protein U0T81_18330 [Saprospiraceae bacterium]
MSDGTIRHIRQYIITGIGTLLTMLFPPPHFISLSLSLIGVPKQLSVLPHRNRVVIIVSVRIKQLGGGIHDRQLRQIARAA